MMLSMPWSTKLYSCPRISSSCNRRVCSVLHQILPLSPKFFTSICLRRTVRSPLHPGNVLRSTMGETTRRLSQLLHKHLQSWKARMPLSFYISFIFSRSLRAPGTIPTSSRLSLNGPIRFNPSRRPSSCPQIAMPLQSHPITNSRTPFNSSPNPSPTRPVGPRWLTARECTGARGRG